MDAFEIMTELAEAARKSKLQLDVASNGKRVRVFVVDDAAVPKSKSTLAPEVSAAPAPATQAVKRAKVNADAPKSSPKKSAAAKPKRLHLNAERVDVLKHVFAEFKSKDRDWDFNEFIKDDDNENKLKFALDHYGETVLKCPKTRMAVSGWWKKFVAGTLESRKGKTKQKGPAATNGTHESSSDSESDDE
jgi:hypothetical protein